MTAMIKMFVFLMVLAAFFFAAPQQTVADEQSRILRTCNAFGYDVPDRTPHRWLRPVAQESVTLTIWADPLRAGVLEQFVSEYMEMHPEVEIVVVEKELNQIYEEFSLAAMSGEGPDIILGLNSWVGNLSQMGLIALLDPGSRRSDFLNVSIRCWVCDGFLYGLPIAVENVAFVRNMELVPDVPADWNEVRTISQELLDASGIYGFVLQEGDSYHFAGIQSAFGGGVFAYDPETGYDSDIVTLNEEGSVLAGEWYQGMVSDGLIPSGLDFSGAFGLFETGQAAMILAGPWMLEQLYNSGIPFEISGLPGGGPPYVGSLGFMVNANSENQGMAADFVVNFLPRYDIMSQFVEGDFRVSAYIPALSEDEDPNRRVFGEVADGGLPQPSFASMNNVYSLLNDALFRIASGELTPQEAFDQAAESIYQVFEESGEG